MTQNIYDTQQFFDGYSHLRRSVEGLAGAPEWPALRAMLPPMQGLKVVDLGCGFGWFCRWAREADAAGVLGLDVSENMLARARAMTDDKAIVYRRADLETLDLPAGAFDLAYSSLTLHYIENLGRLIANIHGALVAHGRFVFSVEHPIYTAPKYPGWITGAEEQKNWPIESYSMEGLRTTDWLAEGVHKYHRTVGTLLNTLIDAGFSLERVEDFCPTEAQIAATPTLAEECERPMFLLVSTSRA